MPNQSPKRGGEGEEEEAFISASEKKYLKHADGVFIAAGEQQKKLGMDHRFHSIGWALRMDT